MNVLGLGELVSILERRAALLRDSPASDPARTALQGLVEWSYDLLHGDEKTLLQQLAVHRGGASLASLVALAATHDLNEATVAYLVAALVDKSIVSASFAGGAARYDMLDTVREYVLERLAESGGLAAARGAHAEYFAALADEARVGLRGPEWLRWQRRLELENDNLWAALALRTRRARPCGRGSARHAGVVLRAGRPRLRGTALPRARPLCHGRRRSGRIADRAARRPLLHRNRRVRSRARRSRPANARSRSPRPLRRRGSAASRS